MIAENVSEKFLVRMECRRVDKLDRIDEERKKSERDQNRKRGLFRDEIIHDRDRKGTQMYSLSDEFIPKCYLMRIDRLRHVGRIGCQLIGGCSFVCSRF